MISATGPVVTATIPIIPSSSTRRKPKFAYRSPSATDGDYNTLPIIRPLINPLPTPSQQVFTKARGSNILLDPTAFQSPTTHGPRRKKYDMGPPLPLYHPFGTLAMSLDPLNATELGLPPLVHPATNRKSVGRSRKTGQSSTDESDLAVMAEVASAAAATEAKSKEKPISPRKKATRGGTSKRKRKDTEDADPTYPAKRPRLPRGAAARDASAAGDAPIVSPPNSSGRVSATPDEPPVEEKKAPLKKKRRSARGGRRRNSSATDEETEGSLAGTQANNRETDPLQTPEVEGTTKASPTQSSKASDDSTQVTDRNSRKLSEPL